MIEWRTVIHDRLRVLGSTASATLLGALLLGCSANTGASPSSSATGSATPSTIEIALEAPLTGDQASTGTDMLNGAQLAVDEVNALGGVLEKRPVLVQADDRADPAAGMKVAQAMVDQRVFAVIGPYNSAVGVKNLKMYLDAGVVVIHLTSNSATNGMGYTVQPKDYQIAPVEAKAISGYFKAKTVAIVYDPQTYTAGIAEQVKTALTVDGAEVIAFEKLDPGAQDYLTLAQNIAAQRPDLLYVSTYYPQGALIAKDLDKLSSTDMPSTDLLCLMGLANQDPAFADSAGLSAARRCSFSGVPSAENFPAANDYVASYKAKFGNAPGTWGTFTYDSVKLLVDAVKRAGAWDGSAVRDQLNATDDFTGITGLISIDPATGNRVDVPVVILTLGADGKYSVDPKWADFAGFGR
jgi:branched-chain amino acid transport system substrate-binding protein